MNSNRPIALLIRVLSIVCLTFSLTFTQEKSKPSDPPIDIVVQGALDSEIQPLIAALDAKEQIQIAAWTFWI